MHADQGHAPRRWRAGRPVALAALLALAACEADRPASQAVIQPAASEGPAAAGAQPTAREAPASAAPAPAPVVGPVRPGELQPPGAAGGGDRTRGGGPGLSIEPPSPWNLGGSGGRRP